jgi:6,7-dimethyl-8-ribityllumazine synthase
VSRTDPPPPAPRLRDPGARMAAVVAGFHRDLAERLLDGARGRLAEAGLAEGHLDEHWVPGAFELPLAAKALAERGRYAALIALGAVIRGETAHFDHICAAAASGISRVGLETGVPVAFGVLTCETRAQAEARSGGEVGNAGADAADAAVVMANLLAASR